MRLFRDANYAFIQNRKPAYILSGTALIIGVAAMLFNVVTLGYPLHEGVDFTGGSLVQVHIEQEGVASQDIRDALGAVPGIDVTQLGDDFVIRAPLEEDRNIDEVRETIEGELAVAFGEGMVSTTRTALVGPKIGAELERKAAGAILFSFILTLIYLAIRFELRFGVAAIIATAHDVLITLGFLALFRVEIDLASVAAILTILGYSLNDTIVVFDRVRENLGKKGARKEDQGELVNRSINETLPRTVLTSGTTLGVLLALLVLGPPVIRDFSVVLILGVIIGTYSSIFVASPALLEIQKRWGEGKRRREKRARPEPGTV